MALVWQYRIQDDMCNVAQVRYPSFSGMPAWPHNLEYFESMAGKTRYLAVCILYHFVLRTARTIIIFFVQLCMCVWAMTGTTASR